ncbi:MAG: TolC family protein [Alphaproteobacteria bacterium]|nr:TolC family protein [Alphaproteobacteria bacterium]
MSKRKFLVHAFLFSLIASCTNAYADEPGWWANPFNDPLATQSDIRSAPVTGCEAAPDKDTILTLANAVQFALCHNPQTRQSWANVMTQAARVGSARSAYLPDVTADVGVFYNIINSTTNGVANNTLNINTNTINGNMNSTNSSFSPSLSLSYLLYDFGAREANVDLTKASLLAADYTHNATLQTILFSTIQAYYQLYSADALVKAAREAVTSNKTSADAATFRYKTGAAAIADQLLAETAYAQAELTMEQARNQREIARGTLANAMGVAPNSSFNMPSSAPDMLVSKFNQSVTDMLENAKKQRPDLAAAAAQKEVSEANINLQRAQAMPTISVSAQEQFNRVITGSNRNSDGTFLGISMRVPLFTGFDRDYQIKAAQQQANAQDAALHNAENNALLDVWRSYNNYDTAKHTIGMTDALIASARKSEQVALGRYKAGAGTITDLLNAQAQLASARQQHVSAEYSLMIAKADLLRSLGALDQTAIAGLNDPKKVP